MQGALLYAITPSALDTLETSNHLIQRIQTIHQVLTGNSKLPLKSEFLEQSSTFLITLATGGCCGARQDKK
jgi:hypothetical protein